MAITDVGVARFIVIKTMNHECILGWDQMSRYGWAFDSRHDVTRWGGRLFATKTNGGSANNYEAALIDACFLTPVLVKHWKVFGEPGKLPAADLPKVKYGNQTRGDFGTAPLSNGSGKKRIN